MKATTDGNANFEFAYDVKIIHNIASGTVLRRLKSVNKSSSGNQIFTANHVIKSIIRLIISGQRIKCNNLKVSAMQIPKSNLSTIARLSIPHSHKIG